MLAMRAADSAPAICFRSDRLCRINGQLFFSTRENTLEGPFDSHEIAEQQIKAYIARMQLLDSNR